MKKAAVMVIYCSCMVTTFFSDHDSVFRTIGFSKRPTDQLTDRPKLCPYVREEPPLVN